MANTVKYPYIDNTGVISRDFHQMIMKAIENGGVLPEELADMITLTKCPEGSACGYSIDWL